jgi:Tol biopolymer transport system component
MKRKITKLFIRLSCIVFLLTLIIIPAQAALAATAAAPVVTSTAATLVAFDGATLNGNLTSKGTAATVNVSFEYGATAAYGKTTSAQPRTAIGAFSAPITGLFPGMTWHYRVIADGGTQGVAYGKDMTFITLSDTTTSYGLDKFAFISAFDGNEEVYAVTPDNVYMARLTTDTYKEAWPKFSTDFSQITYTAWSNVNAEVYVMNPDGTGQKQLTSNTNFDGMSDFSWDRARIAFVSDRDGNYEIYTMNADGSGQARLTDNAASDIMPAFSPDGSKIAFVSNRDGNYEIYTINKDGSGLTRLTNNTVTDNYPSWMNGGSKLAYSTELYGNSQIYVINADGSNMVRLTNSTAVDDQPVWDPTGTWIYFTSWRTSNVPQLFLMMPDGSVQTQLTSNIHGNWSRANWAPPASTLTVNASVLGGHGTVTPQTQKMNTGANASVSITPNSGYHITGITDNGIAKVVANPYVITNAIISHTVVVTFGNTYAITADAGTGGVISPSGAVTVNPGASQMFTITPDNGSTIAALTVDGVAVTPVVNSYQFDDVNANHTISASFSTPPAPDKWWDPTWNYRTEITITEKSGVTLTDYQVKIPVALNANMQANFGDIRFVNSDNTYEISYWMYNVTSTSADFWVKVPLITASGAMKIYMYYGNTAVTTTSNIHTTFIWADDFQDAAWTNSNTHMVNYFGATQSIQNGILQHQGGARGEPILEIYDNGVLKIFPDNYVAEVSVRPNIKAGNSIICPRYTTVMDKYESFMDIFWNNAALNKVVGNTWSQITPAVKVNDPINAGTWYKLTTSISRQGDTNRIMVMLDDTVYIDQTDPSLTNPGLALITFDLNKAFDVSYDNFWVRAYANTEPMSVMGQETKSSGVSTGAATNIDSNRATVNGSAVTGTSSSIKLSFEYGTTTAYGSNKASIATPDVPGSIMAELTGLTPNTLYHFRVKAVGDSTVYGSDVTFTTLPASAAKATSYTTWIVIGAVVLVVLVVVIVVVAAGRKKRLSR